MWYQNHQYDLVLILSNLAKFTLKFKRPLVLSKAVMQFRVTMDVCFKDHAHFMCQI